MWKKASILFGMSALMLVGCNNDDLPETNETPMEDMSEEREMVPEDNNGTDVNPENNDTNLDEDKDMMQDQNTEEEEILEDDLDARDADDKDQ
ncbi:hypothetical protein [Paenisporosarcina quisquiliarum]|uniref:hypothetical protein n=1 Tax=Paenisporosarcina quisquiliarum TaxID=365346 RepID=UPI003734F817